MIQLANNSCYKGTSGLPDIIIHLRADREGGQSSHKCTCVTIVLCNNSFFANGYTIFIVVYLLLLIMGLNYDVYSVLNTSPI